jgi:hypothetical protein
MDCASTEEDDGVGRGCWVANEGRESLQRQMLVHADGDTGTTEP